MRRWWLLARFPGWALACSGLLARAPLLHAADQAPIGAAPAVIPPVTPQPVTPQPAAAAEPERQASEPPPPQRRSGLVLGIAGGLLTSSARGYPNDVAKIDVPQYEANMGLGVAMGGAFWLGGALADW